MGLNTHVRKLVIPRFRHYKPIEDCEEHPVHIRDGSELAHCLGHQGTTITNGATIVNYLDKREIAPYYYASKTRHFFLLFDTKGGVNAARRHFHKLRYAKKEKKEPQFPISEYIITDSAILPSLAILVEEMPKLFDAYCMDVFMNFARKYTDAVFIVCNRQGEYRVSREQFPIPRRIHGEVDIESHHVASTCSEENTIVSISSLDTDHLAVGALRNKDTIIVTDKQKDKIYYFSPREFRVKWCHDDPDWVATACFWFAYAGTDMTEHEYLRCGLGSSVVIKYLVSQLSDEPEIAFLPGKLLDELNDSIPQPPKKKKKKSVLKGEPPKKRRRTEVVPERPPPRKGEWPFIIIRKEEQFERDEELIETDDEEERQGKPDMLDPRTTVTLDLELWRWHARRAKDIKHNMPLKTVFPSPRSAEVNLILRPLYVLLYWMGHENLDSTFFGWTENGCIEDHERESLYFKKANVLVHGENMFKSESVSFIIDKNGDVLRKSTI